MHAVLITIMISIIHYTTLHTATIIIIITSIIHYTKLFTVTIKVITNNYNYTLYYYMCAVTITIIITIINCCVITIQKNSL